MQLDHGPSHSGLGDWYWQRLSALILAVLLPVFFGIFLCVYQGHLDQAQLAALLLHPFSRTVETLLLLALMIHSYTGIKVLIEDYLHTHSLRTISIGSITIFFSLVFIALTALIWSGN
ncbi:MAG: succinate dehydrogenase, hydrophobic membrane anchor protein [Mariprofundaceae bacterium]